MSKYFDTKPGSLEEAVSAAQQAAIAISKKERGEKPKKENNFIYAAKMAKEKGEKTFTVGGKTYDVDEALENNRLKEYVESDGTKRRVKEGDQRLKSNKLKEAYKPVKANHYDVKITLSDKDVAKVKKIIQNFNGEIEDVDTDGVDGGGMKFKGTGDIFIQGDDAGKLGMEIAKAVRSVKVMGETNKNDKSDDGDGLDAVQPDAVKKKFKDRKDKDINNDGKVDSSDKFLHKRRKAVSKAMGESLKETVIAMWQEAAKKSESQDMLNDKDGDGMDDDQKPEKTGAKKKTDTGKPMTPVETSPKMPKVKNEKNKV